VLLVFTLLITSFYFDALLGNHPVRWFYAATGLLMILLVIATSRISMRIVNGDADNSTASPSPPAHRRRRENQRTLTCGLPSAISPITTA
jgi:uncharacterized protein involved in response to NO